MKTFLRRPGNKSKHLKHIIPHIPNFTGTYFEPFLGTGAVYLHILPKKAVLNDLNKDIIAIWKLVKTNPNFIIQEIDKFKKTFLPKSNEMKLKQCKDIVSKMDTYTGDTRTINYLLMIYCSFNNSIINTSNEWYISGLCNNIYSRLNSHIFTENYKSKILELQNILKNVKIENKDYSKVLDKTKKGDFVFLDPPYIEEKKYAFNYNKNEEFSIESLKNEIQKLDIKGVKWMMTQIDTDQVRKIFKGYKFKEYRNNSNFASSKKVDKKELIITNY
jgi:DNA adenine methylase